jgi:hypothetical protein
MVERRRPQDAKAIHVLSSGVKAAATWSRVEALQDCREVGRVKAVQVELKIGQH